MVFLSQNARRGEFARHKMRGKRAVELGAGMGLGGLAFAMLGCDVLLTDVAAVLPLLRRNCMNNLSPAVLRGAFASCSCNHDACFGASGAVLVCSLQLHESKTFDRPAGVRALSLQPADAALWSA